MIHPTAVIHPNARIGADCQIGPYCIIGENVVLGDACRLHSHVVSDGHTTLGSRNEIFPFASIGLKTQDLKWKGGITRTEIGDFNTFREGVTIHSATNDGAATRVGSHNSLLAYTHVAHDCQLGNHIIMSNNASFAAQAAYDELVPAFEALFEQQGRDWSRFDDAVRQLTRQPLQERHDALRALAPTTSKETPGA